MKVTADNLMAKVIAKLTVVGLPEDTGTHEVVALLVDGQLVGASIKDAWEEMDSEPGMTVFAFTVDGPIELDTDDPESIRYIPFDVLDQMDPATAKDFVTGLRYCGIHKHYRHIIESGRARCADCSAAKSNKRAAVRQERSAAKVLALITKLGLDVEDNSNNE